MPANDDTITIRLSRETKAKIKADAALAKRSASDYIRLLADGDPTVLAIAATRNA